MTRLNEKLYYFSPTRFFFIKSKMNGKVLDAKGWEEGEDPAHNCKLIMYSQKVRFVFACVMTSPALTKLCRILLRIINSFTRTAME
jgi:hypothetical protein